MTYGAKFTHGTRSFDLNSAEFDLFRDFSFPAADEALNIGSGTSGNRSGGKVVSKRPQDRWWAWSVRVLGTSKAQTHMAARRLSAWLQQALEDTSSKVYFEFRQNADIPEPIWGQHGAAYRWEVKAAIVDMDGSYYTAEIPVNAIILPISLLVAPYALGKKQLLAQAKGHVFEDTGGTADGQSRGTVVGPATTNLCTNPSFETNTTGWTAVDATLTQTNEQAYVGSYGLRIVNTTSNTAASAYDVIATGAPLAQDTYTAQAWVYINADNVGKTVGIQITELGGAQGSANTSTTITPTAVGWYFLSVTRALAEADRTSVRFYMNMPAAGSFPAGAWTIWDGAMAFVGTAARPYVDGDQIGSSWTGTAHASTSTSVVAYARIKRADLPLFNANQGSICVAVKHRAGYDRGANGMLFTDGVLYGQYAQSTDDWRFNDGTNTVEGAAQTFVSGDIDILHFVWAPGRLEIYRNGAAYAIGTTFTTWALGDYLYIGSSATPALHFSGTFMDFTIWNSALSSTQIAADYADISHHVRGGDGKGQRLSSIPCLWTKDGDNVVDNCTYSTTYNHFAIAMGIPGTTEAETEITGTPSAAFGGLNLSNFATRRYFSPALFFADSSGTAVANTVGGEADVTSLSTTGIRIDSQAVTWVKSAYPELSEVQFYILARIKDAAAGYIRIQPYVTSETYGVNTTTDYSPIYTTSTELLLLRSNLGITQKILDGFNSDTQSVQVYGYRNTGTANITLDYAAMFPRPYLYRYMYAATSFKLSGRDINWITGGIYVGMVGSGEINGDIIEFSPNKYNIFQTLMGSELADPTLALTMTYQIYCTPRYALI